MENLEIRAYAKKYGVKLWEIAEALETNDSRFSKMLRRELPSNQKNHIMKTIERIAEYKQKRSNYVV